MREDLICLIAFILGWMVSRMMGDGFSIGGQEVCRPKRSETAMTKMAFAGVSGEAKFLDNTGHHQSYEEEKIECLKRKTKKGCDDKGAASCRLQEANCVPKYIPEVKKLKAYEQLKTICKGWGDNDCSKAPNTCKSTYSSPDDNIKCYMGQIDACQRCCFDDPDNKDCCDKVKNNCISNIKNNTPKFNNMSGGDDKLYEVFGKCGYCDIINKWTKDKGTNRCMNEYVNTCTSTDKDKSGCPSYSGGGGAIFCPDYLNIVKGHFANTLYKGCPGSYNRPPDPPSPPPPPPPSGLKPIRCNAPQAVMSVIAGKHGLNLKNIPECR